jgi:hypothetical protein
MMDMFKSLFFPLLRSILIACILSSSSWGLTHLNIALHQQINDSLCWAGVSQSVLEYYGITKSQSDIRAYATNGNNVTVPLFNSHNQNRKGIDSILSHLGSITSTGVWDTITLDAIKVQINQDKPVIALLEYMDGLYWNWYPIGHFVTIIGYDNAAIEYLDPKYGNLTYGRVWKQYNVFDVDTNFSSYYDQITRQNVSIFRLWTGSLVLTKNPPYQPAVVGNFGTLSKIIPTITIINSLLLKPYH